MVSGKRGEFASPRFFVLIVKEMAGAEGGDGKAEPPVGRN
jgi:hypothetical protein